MNCNNAPILVSVYDRVSHFKECVESLKRCSLAEESDIYIVSDGPARLEDVDNVNAVREYINSIVGFKNIYKIFREDNMGVPSSINEVFNHVIKKYKKIIFMEDDIIVSSNFLKFINDGLDFYENDKRIYSISGYCPPINIPAEYRHDIFLTHRFSPWGYGTWLDRNERIEISFENIDRCLKQEDDISRYRIIGNDVLISLLTWNKDYYPGDYSICYQMVRNNLFCVTPVVSKTNNIGNDGSGVHCRRKNNFLNPILDEGLQDDIMIKDIQPDSNINNLIKRYYTTLKHDIKKVLYKADLLRFIPKSIYSLLLNSKRK